jgi:hypothetical protein
MKTQIIRVVYVKDYSSHPSGIAIMSALVEALGIEIIHSEPYGNMHKLTLHDNIDIDTIRHVLHKAFPHALSIFREKSEPAEDARIVRVSYVKGASITPTAQNIMLVLVNDLGDEDAAALLTVDDEGVTLKLSGNCTISDVRDILNKEFHHGLKIAKANGEPDATETLDEAYDIFREAAAIMKAKNADYGDSWRLMRLSSITDQILVKIHRVKTIEMSPDAPKVSEGVESEYRDILNYCVFAILKCREEKREG